MRSRGARLGYNFSFYPQRKAILCSGLFNFVWHFSAKGKVLYKPQARWQQCQTTGGSCCAAEQPSSAEVPVPAVAPLSSSRSTAAGSACSGGFAWAMLLSKGPTAGAAGGSCPVWCSRGRSEGWSWLRGSSPSQGCPR